MTVSARARWAKRSRRARGAAMVEALIAIPFFILIFVSILYIGRLYAEKEHTLHEAKQGAWTYALNNCESGAGTTQGGENPQQALDNQGASSNSGVVSQYAPSSGGSSVLRNWDTAVFTANANVVADGLLGGFQNHLSTTTRVQCNEKPHSFQSSTPGGVLGVLQYGWSLLHF